MTIPGLMSMDEFHTKYGEVPYRDNPNNSYSRSMCQGAYISGWFPWLEDEACIWGGPWPGNTVLATISDHTDHPYTHSYAWHADLHKGLEFNAAKFAAEMRGTFHTEKPIRLMLHGNDDTSYAKVYATKEEAISDLYALIVVPTQDNMITLGFVPN